MKPRMLCWFSCGGPSAVAAKTAIEKFSEEYEVLVVCCDTRPSEHPDNYRFSMECEAWFGQPIVFIRNDDYETVDEVYDATQYMSGVRGARCTTELKKVPRIRFARPDDVHVFGFTAGERKRIREFKSRNPDLKLRFVLAELGITRNRALQRLAEAGIPIPAMYRIFSETDRKRYGVDGFDNNNCPGCVKSSSKWYWDMIRKYFPDVFQRRCEQSRKLGVRLVEAKHHQRIFLDELPPGPFPYRRKLEKISCGPECGVALNPNGA